MNSIVIYKCIYNCTAACMGMGTGGNGNSTLGNPMGMGMSQKVGNGMGGNGNVKSHSRTSLLSMHKGKKVKIVYSS